jgi:hypothetical protein
MPSDAGGGASRPGLVEPTRRVDPVSVAPPAISARAGVVGPPKLGPLANLQTNLTT